MITLIGTGHVFDLSNQLLSIFDEKQPELLCVELDKGRFQALQLKKNNPEKYQQYRRKAPILYKILGGFQDKLAQQYGVEAGDEMITAIKYARNHQLPVGFIDLNAQQMFSKMLRKMSFKEKVKLLLSGFGGFFVRKKNVEKELGKFENNFDKYIEQMGDTFPTIKKVLIDERNEYMTKQLLKASEEYDNIIAVMGDGHIPGISKILEGKQDIDFEAIRLKELRVMKTDKVDPSEASFSFEYKNL